MEQRWHTFVISYAAWKQQQERAERQTCKEGGKSGREGKEHSKRKDEFLAHAEDPNMHVNGC